MYDADCAGHTVQKYMNSIVSFIDMICKGNTYPTYLYALGKIKDETCDISHRQCKKIEEASLVKLNQRKKAIDSSQALLNQFHDDVQNRLRPKTETILKRNRPKVKPSVLKQVNIYFLTHFLKNGEKPSAFQWFLLECYDYIAAPEPEMRPLF